MIQMNRKIATSITISFSIINLILVGFLIYKDIPKTNNRLSFVNEDVNISVNDSHAYFTARYGMQNNGILSNYWILLPIALKPWNIEILIAEQQISYSWTTCKVEPEMEIFVALLFLLPIPIGEYRDIFVNYERNYSIIQQDNSSVIEYKYIVGSTRSWSSPLQFAHFKFWYQTDGYDLLVEERDFYNWMPKETFLIFHYPLLT
ncbi:MAG: hypothetical protein ACFFDW_16675 [Candidatus Thorarchaeota archaeon]